MADIKLDFGVEGLDGLKKLLTEIEKSAKRLTALIEKAGAVTDDDVLKAKRLAAEYKKAENELKKQELASKRIADQQERVNQKQRESKGIIGGLEAEVKRLRSSLKAATDPKQIDAINKKLRETQNALQKAKGTTASWGKALGSFQFKFNALGNIAANVLQRMTSQISEVVRESAKLAAQAEGVERAFRSLNQPKLLSELKQATSNTVSDLKLMTAAVKANNFKIPLEQLPKYFQFASQRAIETGESVDYLVESIVNGVARKSLPILDNLGLSATELREEMAKTGDMAEAVANIIDRSMGDANQPLLTTAQLYAQAAAETENMQRQFGEIINLVGVKLLPYTEKFVGFLKEALQTQSMIQRQVLDANILYQIEQDRAEAEFLANKFRERGAELLRGQTYEQEAAFYLLDQYRTLLQGTGKDEAERIEQITAQIKALEVMAGIAPKPESVLGEDQNIRIERQIDLTKDLRDAIKEVIDSTTLTNWEEFAKAQQRIMEMTAEFLEMDNSETIAEDPQTEALIERHRKEIEAETKHQEDLQKIKQESWNLAARAVTAYADLVESQKQKELSAAGDSAKAREAIERRYAEKQRKLAIFEALIAGGAASAKAWQQYGWPWALVPQAIIAADVGAQIATISNAKYAEGGEIFGEPHSRGGVNIEAEGGEYVINKRSTSKYKDLIRAINEDDQVRIMDAMSRDRKIEINKGQDPWTKKMYEHMRGTVSYWEDNEFFYTKKGNITHKIRKN